MNSIWETQNEMLTKNIEANQHEAKRFAVKSLVSIERASAAYQGKASRNGVKQPLLAVRLKPKEIKITLFEGDEIFTGDVVSCFGEQWIVVERFEDECGNRFATAWICNHVFVWQNGTGTILKQAGILDDGTYSSKHDQQLPLEEGRYKVYLPLNEDTKKIFVDKRFAIGKIFGNKMQEILSVIKTVWIDSQSGNLSSGDHLLKLQMNKDLFNSERDNIEAMICDYIESLNPVDPPDVDLSKLRCMIDGRDTIRIGTSRNYTAYVINEDDIMVDTADVDFVWEFNDIPGILFTIDNSQINIQTPLDLRLVGSMIDLIVSDRDNEFIKKKLQIEIIS